MYESILKQATGNPNLKFKVTTAPFPVRAYLKQFQEQANGVFIVFVVAIGFALIPASMVSHIVSERVKSLKHMQVLAGMNLTAYWISNMLFDICKALIPCGIVIGLLYAFDFFVSMSFPIISNNSMTTYGACSSYTRSVWSPSLTRPASYLPLTPFRRL